MTSIDLTGRTALVTGGGEDGVGDPLPRAVVGRGEVVEQVGLDEAALVGGDEGPDRRVGPPELEVCRGAGG